MKAVIFDNDGVVIDSEPIVFEATANVFASYGIKITKKDVEDGIGAGSKYVSLPRDKYSLTTIPIEKLMEDREKLFRAIAPGQLKPFPGFFRVIEFLKKRGFFIALASSAATEVVYHNLKIAQIDNRLFDVIVDSSKIKKKKPAPDIFLQAIKQLGVAPHECVVVEDAPAGIQAAHGAGIKVVAFTGSLPKEKLTDADFTVDSMEELLVLMQKLCSRS